MPKRYIDKNYQKSSGPGRAGPKADSEWAGPGLDLFLSGPGRARPLTKKTGPGRAGPWKKRPVHISTVHRAAFGTACGQSKKKRKCDAFKNITNKKIVLVFYFWRAGPWSFSTGPAAAEKTRGVAKKPARGHEMNTHTFFCNIKFRPGLDTGCIASVTALYLKSLSIYYVCYKITRLTQPTSDWRSS